MIKSIWYLSLILFVGSSCLAQSNDHQGIQLSIALTNNIFRAGSLIAISSEINNPSTNIVYLTETDPASDFVISITNDSGKTYRLTSDRSFFPRFLRVTINILPGKRRDWLVSLILDKNIEAGDYKLKATRSVYTGGISFKLESNLLKVQVK
jgi:hypothetical protein